MAQLYIVPTPIGNLEDITLRAIRVLKEADFILAEDTRHTAKLLKHYSIDTKTIPYHQNNEHRITNAIVREVGSGKSAALVSDAGTPGISDAGYLLVRECIKNNIAVTCLPGPTAFVPAIVQSGLPSDRFSFEGFLPRKKGRAKRLKELAEEKRTMVIYESPHRLAKTLRELNAVFGSGRETAVLRELTKIYEETSTGQIEELLGVFEKKKIKGEIVIVVKGSC